MSFLSARQDYSPTRKKQDIMSNYIPDSYPELLYIQKNYTPEQIYYISELDLSNSRATRMPNVNYTMKTFFSQLTLLNLSHNQIKHIHASDLSIACPQIETFNISYNEIHELDELLGLGKLKKLESLDFSGNPMQCLNKPFIILQNLLLSGCIDHFMQNKLQILNMQNINTMVTKVNESHLKNLQKEKAAECPRKNGSFRHLRQLNGKMITQLDMFNTLYFECFPQEFEENKKVRVKGKSISFLKPPKPNQNFINNKKTQHTTNNSPQQRGMKRFSTFEAASSIYPRLKKQMRQKVQTDQELEYEKQKMVQTFYSKMHDSSLHDFSMLKKQMSGSKIKIKDAIQQADTICKTHFGHQKDQERVRRRIPLQDQLNFQENTVVRAEAIKNERIGLDDKILYNKQLIKNISNSESKIMRRKQLHKAQMKKHDKVMNKIKKPVLGSYQLSDESSDMDEFFTLEDYKKSHLKNHNNDLKTYQEPDEEELEEIDYFRKKQKSISIGASQEKSQILLDQHKSLKRLVKFSLQSNSKGQNNFINMLNLQLRDELLNGKIDDLHNQQMIKSVLKMNENSDQDSDDVSLVSFNDAILDSERTRVTPTPINTSIKEATTAASTMGSGWTRTCHNKTQSMFMNNNKDDLPQADPRNGSADKRERQQSVFTPGIIKKLIFKGSKITPFKDMKFYDKDELQSIIQNNNDQFTKDVNVISNLVKDHRNSKEVIRKLMNQDLFKSKIINPEIKMKMINDKVLGIKPQVLRDAENLALREKKLLDKIRDIDPNILSEGCQPLDVDEVRNVYYQVMQDKYQQQDLKKLKSVLLKLYPKTQKILSERKVREILKTQALTLPQERVEFLQKYLSLTTQLQLYPTQNESKEEWSKKLVLMNEWENKRESKKNPLDLKQKQQSETKILARKQKKLLQQVTRGNFNLQQNFGNNKESLSMTLQNLKEQKKNVERIDIGKRLKTDDVMTITVSHKDSIRKQDVERTAFKRWNKILSKQGQLGQGRSTQIKVINDFSESLQLTKTLDESLESEKNYEDYQKNKMKIHSQRTLCAIVNKSMKTHGQIQ